MTRLLPLLLAACTAKDTRDSLRDSTPGGGDSADSATDSQDSGDSAPVPVVLGAVAGEVVTLLPDAERVSFTAPFAPGALADLEGLRLEVDGQAVPFAAEPVLGWWGPTGEEQGVRTALVQFEAAWLGSGAGALALRWGVDLEGEGPSLEVVDPGDDAVSAPVAELAQVAERTIVEVDGAATLVEVSTSEVSQYESRQPRALVLLEPAAWAQSGALGPLPAVEDWAGLGLAGLEPLGEAMLTYARAASFQYDYRLHPDSVGDPTSPNQWEFGRCSTVLQAAVMAQDAELAAEAHRLCGWYTTAANAWAGELGLWTIGGAFSGLLFHGRDLFGYAAYSGDLPTLNTTHKLTAAWLDSELVQGYRGGRLAGEKWTEQLLGAAVAALWYGYLSSGDTEALLAVEDLVGSLHTHLTGSADELAAMGVDFPPQGCLVHSATLAEEGEDPLSPWCSPWQMATLLDPLLQYRDLTGDARVDEIFLTVGRWLRDQATAYGYGEWPYCDSFTEPMACYEAPAEEGEDFRILTPLYSAAVDAEGQAVRSWNWGDHAHCPDVSALAAAALAVVARDPSWDAGPVGPFASERASLEALHQELLACAVWNMDDYYHRPKRNPAYWTSDLLAEGLADPTSFINSKKIGYPDRALDPLRLPSWWFNAGLTQVAELAAAGVQVVGITPGALQPVECADVYATTCEGL